MYLTAVNYFAHPCIDPYTLFYQECFNSVSVIQFIVGMVYLKFFYLHPQINMIYLKIL